LLKTKRLLLIPFNDAHFQALLVHDMKRLSQLLDIVTPDTWTTFEDAKEAIPFFYDMYKNNDGDTRFGSYFVILENEKRLIGTGGFKGHPDIVGYVEIGYEIDKNYQNQGYATELVNGLIYFTFGEGYQKIIAHTLPENNASGIVLKKNGFKFKSIVCDPEDGMLWKYELKKAK
jgi:[ribosomal protein S5]-alanine N-acetyltransferase